MREQGYNLGGEQSGHFIFLDYSTTGDGIVSAVQLLRFVKASGQPLSELRKRMTKFPQTQRSVRVTSKPPLTELAASAVIRKVEEELGDAGRILVRYSGTEALLRVLVEGRDAAGIERQADEIGKAIADEIGA
jgi:phosphoglucosamine mutase